MIKTRCLSCAQQLNLIGPVEIGHRILCPHCHTEQEVVWMFPIQLDFPEKDTPPSRTLGDRPTIFVETV